MKIPINCPFCNDVMLTDYTEYFHDNKESIHKICSSKIDHSVQYVAWTYDDFVYEIILRIALKPLKYAKWLMGIKVLRIDTDNKTGSLYLPWFDPNSMNHKQIIEKLKTYILFS
jgi:hypothetical protein